MMRRDVMHFRVQGVLRCTRVASTLRSTEDCDSVTCLRCLERMRVVHYAVQGLPRCHTHVWEPVLTTVREAVTCKACQRQERAIRLHYVDVEGNVACGAEEAQRTTHARTQVNCPLCLFELGIRTSGRRSYVFPAVYRHYGEHVALCGTTELGWARTRHWRSRGGRLSVTCPQCQTLRTHRRALTEHAALEMRFRETSLPTIQSALVGLETEGYYA